MSRGDIETLAAGFEAFNRDGFEAILELIDPEFEAEAPPELSTEPDTYRGYEGVRRYFATFEEAMEDIRFDPEEFIDAGEHVVIPMRLSATGRGTGIRVEQRIVQVWTMRNGRAVRVRTYASRAEALAAAGLAG